MFTQEQLINQVVPEFAKQQRWSIQAAKGYLREKCDRDELDGMYQRQLRGGLCQPIVDQDATQQDAQSSAVDTANEIIQLRAKLADDQARAQRLAVEYELVAKHGLANTLENKAMLYQLFPHSLTVESLYRAFKAGVAGGLLWNGKPFAGLAQDEQQQQNNLEKARRIFDVVARAVTQQGYNTASNDANFLAVCEVVPISEFSIVRITNAIMSGEVTLSPNDSETVNQFDSEDRLKLWNEVAEHLSYTDGMGRIQPSTDEQTRQIRDLILNGLTHNELRERFKLAKRIAKTFGSAEKTEFRRLLLSTVIPIENLRNRVQEMDRVRSLREMTPEQIREQNKRNQQAPTMYQPIPAELTREKYLATARATDPKSQQLVRHWHERFGHEQIKARLRGEV